MTDTQQGYSMELTASIRVWRILLSRQRGWVADALTQAIAEGKQDDQGRHVVTLGEHLATHVVPEFDELVREAADDGV